MIYSVKDCAILWMFIHYTCWSEGFILLLKDFFKLKNLWQSWRYTVQLSWAQQNDKPRGPVFEPLRSCEPHPPGCSPPLTKAAAVPGDDCCRSRVPPTRGALCSDPPHLPGMSFSDCSGFWGRGPDHRLTALPVYFCWLLPLFFTVSSPIDHFHIKSQFSVCFC